MKDFAGTPGTVTGLVLRMAQCLFAAGSIASMSTTKSFFNFTAFWEHAIYLKWVLGGYGYTFGALLNARAPWWSGKHDCLLGSPVIADVRIDSVALGRTNMVFHYLIASMGLQVFWSFGLAFLDAYALAKKKVLHNPGLVSLFVVGDWVTATLTLAAASSSAGITVLYFDDLGRCSFGEECQKYQMAVALAFLSWISIAISALIMFWLLAAG